jgi:hypothetical protein
MTAEVPAPPRVADLDRLLREKAPDNTAEFPLMVTKQRDGSWWVCVHARTEDADFNIEATTHCLDKALSNVVGAIKDFDHVKAEATRTDRRLGICPE